MSFKRKAPKLAPVIVPAPTDPVDTDTDRKRRLSSGGVRSTLLGRMAQSALPSAGSTLTGVSGG